MLGKRRVQLGPDEGAGSSSQSCSACEPSVPGTMACRVPCVYIYMRRCIRVGGTGVVGDRVVPVVLVVVRTYDGYCCCACRGSNQV